MNQTFFFPDFDAPPLRYPSGNGAVTAIGSCSGFSPEAYMARLKGIGFEAVDCWHPEGCFFATLRRGTETVVLVQRGADLRVTLDSYTGPFFPVSPTPEAVPTTLWMHETDHSMIDCGMCLMVQCADGSFFVVDSGHFLQTNDNDRIYRFMRARTPRGQKVRIAGWFLSHAHDDHICKFYDYLKYNMEDSVLEAVYHNLPDPGTTRSVAGWASPDASGYPIANLNTLLDSMASVRKIRLYTGQRFAVRNLRFTVLCTHIDTVPTADRDFNNTSTVLMMEAAGHKALLCGDASDLESAVMEEAWGTRLSCDVLQVAHHGHHGCSRRFYSLSGGKIALFANTRVIFKGDMIREQAVNSLILQQADHSYLSSDGTVEVNLATLESRQLPDETFEDFDMIHRLWGYNYTDAEKQELYALYLAHGGKPNAAMDHPPV